MKTSNSAVERLTLYQEFRLIEKSESEINTAWKGAHLLLFFLAFVFGLFCTFCFHVLMYLFDEKCVLFPKLLSLKDMRRSSTANGIILDYIADKDSAAEELPVDFVTTQWMDQSTCLLPTYVPLLSGICGLVWTTMFLMCSSGSRTLTGLQRPWRILPAIFIFSLALGGLCTYTSFVTQYGLEELCSKLGEFTGSSTCTYTINVATLAYERRIRGVYQATQLTMASAWLHTGCWIGAALLALARVVLLIDFRLVRVRADLQGNIEKMLERQEKHIKTDEIWIKDDGTSTLNDPKTGSYTSVKVRFTNKDFGTDSDEDTIQYSSEIPPYPSTSSFVCEETREMELLAAYKNVAKEHAFIVIMIDNMVESLNLTPNSCDSSGSYISIFSETSEFPVRRQIGQRLLRSKSDSQTDSETILSQREAEELALTFRRQVTLKDIKRHDSSPNVLPTITAYESIMNITPEMKAAIEKREASIMQKNCKKSNLKSKSVQTHVTTKKSNIQKVQLLAPFSSNASTATLTPDNLNVIKKLEEMKNIKENEKNKNCPHTQPLKIYESDSDLPFIINPSFGSTDSRKELELRRDQAVLKDQSSSDLNVLFETQIKEIRTTPGQVNSPEEIEADMFSDIQGVQSGQDGQVMYSMRNNINQVSQTGSSSSIRDFVRYSDRQSDRVADQQTPSTSRRYSTVDKETQTREKEKQD